MSNKNYILFIDSGIGGLSILKYFVDLEKDVNIIYFADTLNYPYGKKDEQTLGNILLNIYNSLKNEFDISLIVIACNTASVSALSFLRSKISIPVIGTVPAIKPAAQITKNNRIGIIATETTVKLDYIQNLIKEFAKNKEVFIKASPKLVDAAENFYQTEKIEEILKEELSFFLEKDIDTLVLGCTHYSFLIEDINNFFNNKVKILDSREGVSKRIIQLLPEEVRDKNSKKLLFISHPSIEVRKKYQRFNEILQIFDTIDYHEILLFNN